ncbi:MAG: hypothetical protein U0795_01890 [Pirellulales bacterium]
MDLYTGEGSPDNPPETIIATASVEVFLDTTKCRNDCAGCAGDAKVYVSFTWSPMTNGEQHTLGSGPGFDWGPGQGYHIDIWWGEGTSHEPLDWNGIVEQGGQRVPFGSEISKTVYVGTLPCDGHAPNSTDGSAWLIGTTTTIAATSSNLEEEGTRALDTAAQFKINYGISVNSCGVTSGDTIELIANANAWGNRRLTIRDRAAPD